MISLDWNFTLRFGRVPEQQHSGYHLRKGDGQMGKWSDEFGNDFEGDSHKAEVNAERQLQRQRTIDGNQGRLWGKLKEMAREAVADINSSRTNDLLLFTPEEMVNSKEFVISYTRGGRTTEVTAEFDRSEHKVKVSDPRGKRDYS